jgi:RNA polymerase sigma factor (sigma-70 family)
MLIPNTQRILLKDILEQFEVELTIDDRKLDSIYQYLFDSNLAGIIFNDAALNDTVYALKDIVEMEQITSLESIIRFLRKEDEFINDCMIYLKTDINTLQAEENEAANDYDHDHADCGIGLLDQAVVAKPALSRYFISADSFKDKDFVEAYKNCRGHLKKIIISILSSEDIEVHELANDLLQEAIFEAWQIYHKSISEGKNLIKLLKSCATKEAVQAVSDHKRAEIVSLDIVARFPSVSSYQIELEARDMLEYIINRFKGSDGDLIQWMLLGLSTSELSKFLQISPRAVSNRIKRLRKKIRNDLEIFDYPEHDRIDWLGIASNYTI